MSTDYNFYTSIHQFRDTFLVRGYRDGQRFQEKIHYKPHVFVPSSKPNRKWKTIEGYPLGRVRFDSIKDCRNFIKEYSENENTAVYGFTQFEYVYLNETYPGTIKYDPGLIEVVNFDIEVDNKGRNIDETIDLAVDEVTAINLRHRGKSYAFGCGDYEPKVPDSTYVKCKNEAQLLLKFLRLWEHIAPDVMTGWNTEWFDIPFLFRRITNLLGRDHAIRLSPWKIVIEKKLFDRKTGKEGFGYEIFGVTSADYLILYKKFTYTQQEQYSLNYIANEEIGRGKLDYSDYENLYDLHAKNFQLFMEYNETDTELVDAIDAKMGLLNQMFAIAFDAHVTLADALTSVRIWDVIIYRKLAEKFIAVPPKKQNEKTEQIAGAYVKEPVPGRYSWCVSFDLTSLYPHLVMGTNISPETLTNGKLPVTVESILNGELNNQEYDLLSRNVSVAGSGYMFDKSYQGFLPQLMDSMFKDRSVIKKQMLKAEQELEDIETEMRRRNLL